MESPGPEPGPGPAEDPSRTRIDSLDSHVHDSHREAAARLPGKRLCVDGARTRRRWPGAARSRPGSPAGPGPSRRPGHPRAGGRCQPGEQCRSLPQPTVSRRLTSGGSGPGPASESLRLAVAGRRTRGDESVAPTRRHSNFESLSPHWQAWGSESRTSVTRTTAAGTLGTISRQLNPRARPGRHATLQERGHCRYFICR